MIEIPKEHKTGYSERGSREGSETVEINPDKESEIFIKKDQCTNSSAESIPLVICHALQYNPEKNNSFVNWCLLLILSYELSFIFCIPDF